MAKNKLIQPFLKWAGGKRQLLKEIEKYVPKYSTYYEPFLGGGAVLFHLEPKKAVINDVNPELTNVYKVVRDNVDELLEELGKHENTPEHFYAVREWDRKPNFNELSDVKRAARLIYLNKTCFNGLFRVNSNGEFNTPFGNYKNPDFKNPYVLRAVSMYLKNNDIRIMNTDFEEAVKHIRKGAFVYFDPPYYPLSDSSSFTGYTLDGFDKDDQIRLKKLCDKLHERRVKFLLSNSAAPFIIDLYNNKEYKVEYVKARRAINSNAKGRGEIKEVLIRNYG